MDLSVTESSARTVEVTRHAKERWVQRICQENIPEKSLSSTIYRNETRITLDILEAFSNAEHLWQGSLWPGMRANNFWINGDVIFLTDVNNTDLITVYRVELPFPDPVTQEVVKKSVSQIRGLKAKIRKHKDKWIPWYKRKRDEQKEIEDRMKQLQAEFDAKMAALKQKHEDIGRAVHEREKVTDAWSAQIEEYARIVCNSLTFKTDYEKNLR